MIEFEVVTNFYSLIPWITVGLLIAGIVLAIAAALVLGWWIGNKSTPKKSYKIWFGIGWLPIFAIFVGCVFTGTSVYYDARNDLSAQVKDISNLSTVTFYNGNDHLFVGRKDDNTLVSCNITDLQENNKYRVRCR